MLRWRRRSRLIHFLRKALPAAMAAVVLLMVGWVGFNSLRAAFSDLMRAGTVIHMTNPQFFGQDDHGRNFMVAAAEAQRTVRNGATTIILTSPHLKLAGTGGRAIEVVARQGTFDDPTQRVKLQGDVHVSTGDGTTFRTQLAVIDMRTGEVVGDSPVEGSGPLGQIRASSYAIHDRGAHAVFDGQVHAHLVQRH
jgi:lipopolysaccharide export system protein LptC